MSRNPVVMTLPPFHGVVKRLILTSVVVFFLLALLAMFGGGGISARLVNTAMLHPDEAIGRAVWQFATYPFVGMGLLSLLLASLSLWFFASRLEGERGSLWMGEYFFVSAIAGGLLASLLARFVLMRVPEFAGARAGGLWPAVMAVMLAYAKFHPDDEIRVYFILPVRVKYLVAIYLLVYLALALTSGGRFEALLTLCCAVSGYAYLQLAPRRGLRFAGSEWIFGLRNSFYRRKRRNAAKKFTVYMKKQGKDVNLDAGGKYISLDDERKDPRRDPNDRRWMN
jgi:membrane associated rhomboid family serine protease